MPQNNPMYFFQFRDVLLSNKANNTNDRRINPFFNLSEISDFYRNGLVILINLKNGQEYTIKFARSDFADKGLEELLEALNNIQK